VRRPPSAAARIREGLLRRGPFWGAVRGHQPPEHAATAGARLRNVILRGLRGDSLWGAIQGAAPGPDRARELLWRRGLSLGGRLTDRTYCAQARAQEYLFAIDEVVKAVAYALVAAGLKLVAAAGTEFVLEAPEEQATETVAAQVAERARRAQAPYLGALPSPCLCRWQDEW
jgi:hypothetical protein